MTATTLRLKGMSCAACANSIESAIRRVPGVSRVQVNFAAEQASVAYDKNSTTLEEIQSAVANAGYEAAVREGLSVGEADAKAQDERANQQKALLIKTVVSGAIGTALILGTLPMMLGVTIPGWPMFLHNPWLQLVLATPVLFWCGQSFYVGDRKSVV